MISYFYKFSLLYIAAGISVTDAHHCDADPDPASYRTLIWIRILPFTLMRT
jgi:hypothetical protein